VGRLLAWRLLRQGHRVTLFDDGPGDGENAAGLIAAAMVAPCSEIIAAERAVYQPGLQALAQWPQWLTELRGDSAIEVSFQRRGSLVIAHPTDQADLRHFFHRLGDMAEVPADHYRWITHRDLQALEPELDRFSQAVFLPEEGCLDNRALFRALRQAIQRRHGTWHCQHKVVTVDGHRITTETGSLNVDLALDCRGFGGKGQLGDFRGVRGEVLWVRAPEVRLSRPVRLMHPRYQLYIAPKPDSVYVIGATEIESESRAPVTVRSSLELLSALYSVHPGFGEANVLEARASCRPAFLNNLPKIVRAPGLLRVNGLYRHGYLLGPALVNSVTALLADEPVLAPVTVEDEHCTPLPCTPLSEITP